MTERCACGHAKGMHPFGLSENLVFNGHCMICGCESFSANGALGVDGGRIASPEAAVSKQTQKKTVSIETLEQVIAKLEALYEKWTEHSRNLNHDGKRELESYYDGKREGLREAAHEVWYAKQKLEALIRQETE